MYKLIVVTGLALAACSSPHSDNVAAADLNSAAEQAQGDIDTYAANTLAASAPVASTATPVAKPSGTVGEPSAAPESAQAAAKVVQTYFALIEARKYGEAWLLWGDGGRASGMTAAAFAASFAKYADYRADVGPPGDVEAGAGQRYVTVPVRTYGTLAEGKPFVMQGNVMLHRTDVDGATAEQRSWRISDSSLKPRPQEAAAARPTLVAARYNCAGATRISARFDADTTADRRPAAGIWYKAGGDALQAKADAGPGAAPTRCTNTP